MPRNVLHTDPTHRYKYDYHRNIAWAVDVRGDEDDVPTLVYAGAPLDIIKSVFRKLFDHRTALMQGFQMYYDYYPYQRQGKVWYRIAVELHGFNDQMMSVSDLGVVMQGFIQKACICRIKKMKLETLLNI